MSKHNITYLFGSALLFSLAAVPVWAQVTATIQNTAAGQSNGAISLNFPEGYPTDQLEGIVWYPLDADHNYIPDGSGNATVQPEDDSNTPIEIGGLSTGWYRVVYNRVGWCNAAQWDFEVEVCVPTVFPTFVVSSDCGADALGSISINPPASAEPYTYKWYNSDGVMFSAATEVTGLEAGTYTVVMTETNTNCAHSESIVIESAPPLVVSNILPLCPGTIGVIVEGGSNNSAPSTYSIWDNAAQSYTVEDAPVASSVGNYSWLIHGLPTDYTLSIQSANNCLYSRSDTWATAYPPCHEELEVGGTVESADEQPNATPDGVSVRCTTDAFGTDLKISFYMDDTGPNFNPPYHIWYENGTTVGHTTSGSTLPFGKMNVTILNLPPDAIDDESYCAVLTNNNGCVVAYGTFGCNQTIVGEYSSVCSPVPYLSLPALTEVTACPGETIYYDFYVSCEADDLTSNQPNAIISDPNDAPECPPYEGQLKLRRISWTIPLTAAGTHQLLSVRAARDGIYSGGGSCESIAIALFDVEVQPQPTVTAWQPQVLSPLVRDCKGDVWLPALVQINPQYDAATALCAPVFALGGVVGNTVELYESGTQTIIANYEGLDIPLSVAIPETQLNGSELELTAEVSHSHSNCGDDICDGAVTIQVLGGSGQYEYEWSDGCQWHPYDPAAGSGGGLSPNPNGTIGGGGSGDGSDCSGAWHGNLCSGNYSVTLTDSQTGCTAQTNFAVGMYVSQGNTEVLTYTAAAELIKPDIRLAPALFDSQTKVEYTLPEDGFVTIKVYNLQGILVETLVSNEYRTAGSYQLNDEGGEYANGLYLFSLEVCNRNKAVMGIKY